MTIDSDKPDVDPYGPYLDVPHNLSWDPRSVGGRTDLFRSGATGNTLRQAGLLGNNSSTTETGPQPVDPDRTPDFDWESMDEFEFMDYLLTPEAESWIKEAGTGVVAGIINGFIPGLGTVLDETGIIDKGYDAIAGAVTSAKDSISSGGNTGGNPPQPVSGGGLLGEQPNPNPNGGGVVQPGGPGYNETAGRVDIPATTGPTQAQIDAFLAGDLNKGPTQAQIDAFLAAGAQQKQSDGFGTPPGYKQPTSSGGKWDWKPADSDGSGAGDRHLDVTSQRQHLYMPTANRAAEAFGVDPYFNNDWGETYFLMQNPSSRGDYQYGSPSTGRVISVNPGQAPTSLTDGGDPYVIDGVKFPDNKPAVGILPNQNNDPNNPWEPGGGGIPGGNNPYNPADPNQNPGGTPPNGNPTGQGGGGYYNEASQPFVPLLSSSTHRPQYGHPGLGEDGPLVGLLQMAGSGNEGQTVRPSILPAANSGQASWQQYQDNYANPNYGEDAVQGLLGSINSKRYNGLI